LAEVSHRGGFKRYFDATLYLQPDAALTVIWLMDNSEKEVNQIKDANNKKTSPGRGRFITKFLH